MASSTNYQDLLAAAYRNLGQVNAEIDAQSILNKNRYDEALVKSLEGRKKSAVSAREASSSRGLLDSTIALQGQADVNSSYDQQNTGYMQSYEETLRSLASKRLAAQNQYEDARLAADRENYLAGITPDTLAINDPNNPANPDPLGWGAIDAGIKNGTIKDPRIPVATPQQANTRTINTVNSVVNPIKITKPTAPTPKLPTTIKAAPIKTVRAI